MSDTAGGTTYTSICQRCGKLFIYVGDIPPQGFIVGNEPYCTCGTVVCKECGKRYTPREQK